MKRCHGLGNVILLMPVLDYLCRRGCDVCLVTRREWAVALAVLRPGYRIATEAEGECFDLDEMTSHVLPSRHRTDELARLLGLDCRLGSLRIETPSRWSRRFEYLAGSVILAPEAAHPSRRWPRGYCNRVIGLLGSRRVVVIGTDGEPDMECDTDLRGQLDTEGLFGVIAVSRVVISMDSAVLHIAAAMRKPTVAIFGGVDFRYRVRDDQPVVAMQASMPCCPCNKTETCADTYDCIKSIEPQDVLNAMAIAERCDRRVDYCAGAGAR